MQKKKNYRKGPNEPESDGSGSDAEGAEMGKYKRLPISRQNLIKLH